MNVSITRAAGSEHDQELPSSRIVKINRAISRMPNQRNTLYVQPPEERRRLAFDARRFSRSCKSRADGMRIGVCCEPWTIVSALGH
jgi:hypothetical protein